MLGLGVLLVLAGGAGFRRMALVFPESQVVATPSSVAISCRVCASASGAGKRRLSWRSRCRRRPPHFPSPNIFARASGYIDKRNVDIGDHVKEGQLLAQIVAPELDHQIAQAEATLVQLKAAVQQAQANKELAQVTWERDSPLVEQGLGDPAAGHHRRADPQGAGGRGRRRASQCSGAARRRFRCSTSRRPISASSRRSTASSPSATSTSAAWCRPMRSAARSCSPSCRAT